MNSVKLTVTRDDDSEYIAMWASGAPVGFKGSWRRNAFLITYASMTATNFKKHFGIEIEKGQKKRVTFTLGEGKYFYVTPNGSFVKLWASKPTLMYDSWYKGDVLLTACADSLSRIFGLVVPKIKRIQLRAEL